MSCGVIYMVWGDKAASAAESSIASLQKVSPDLPILIVGDVGIGALAERLGAACAQPQVDPFEGVHFWAGRVKPLLYELSPWERTLYVDADTKFRRGPEAGFALLDKWDFIVAETGNRSMADQLCGRKEAEYSRKFFGTSHLLYHNSGMLFWKRNERVKKLFALWSSEWKRWSGWDEQVALMRALARSEAIFLTAPFTWNTNFPSQAKLLFHDFGQRVAWKFKRRRGSVMTADELRLLASEVRKRPPVMARRREVKQARVRDEEEPIMTGAALRKRALRKPPMTPLNKAVETPRQNKGAENV